MDSGPAKIFHVPVLVNEVLEVLAPCFGTGTIVDATVGGGGHAAAIARRIAEKVSGSETRGRLIGLDVDPEAIAAAARTLADFGCRTVDFLERDWREFKEMILLVRSSYVNIGQVVERLNVFPVTGVLMDLGISSAQLDSERGFAFDRDTPLDMRFDSDSSRPTALTVLRRASLQDLRFWLKEYGEEPLSGRISRRIYEWKNRIKTTRDLAGVVAGVVPRQGLRKRLARVFQALRIVVNNELDTLKKGLKAAVDVLAPGGRLVVICYQSGEDRCFKELFRQERSRLRLLTAKPIRPSVDEVRVNPRARSARLRAVERI